MVTHPRPLGPARGPLVIKIGGRALDSAAAAMELADEVKALAGAGRAKTPAPGNGRAADAGRGVILIHGGGAEVTGWCERLGLAPRFHDGLRVSDPATLEVAVAVLAGLANKRLVAGLQAAGIEAVGLAALDGGIVAVVPHADAAVLGAVGAVDSVAPALLATLLERGAVPVLASIGAHQGRLLNLNADDLAAAIAPALGAATLILLSDTPGLKLGGAVVPALDRAGLAAAISHPDVQGGMAPKLRAAQAALEAGVRRVIIASWQGEGTVSRLLAGEAAGTTITRASAKETANG